MAMQDYGDQTRKVSTDGEGDAERLCCLQAATKATSAQRTEVDSREKGLGERKR